MLGFFSGDGGCACLTGTLLSVSVSALRCAQFGEPVYIHSRATLPRQSSVGEQAAIHPSYGYQGERGGPSFVLTGTQGLG